ncbi:unnamed protein product (macronuclear) [Paramecium tetraurelia]|uniref:Ku domain-containing protein n=1 Tax=Paramecium tetraurelia TaxID=5888 RepID=A0CGF3_PARTE|nr:uncharacterized protein GSPATT00007310001 [Paramecium tetraurelia]CAK69870.1 unnamed protein product [Paramecium tetraurelia]|eukprot:XP_001437267.1 hypothetical protein (macronuclear) [Paramecium tetraurelia strain d4-2]
MNFTFMIDNCLSSCQITYNGLTILDYAKSAIEYFVKKRTKNPENKYDQYHLFSSNSSISTWTNDVCHFLQKLKTIQPQFETNFNLDECFHNLNKFRTLNGTDNLYGGRDVLKIESAIIFVFTNREYMGSAFHQLVRWDYRLLVFLLQPPGIEETNAIPISTNWHHLAASVGQGVCFEIQDYNVLFQILDDPKLTPPQISLQLNLLDQQYKLDEILSNIEKTKIDQQSSLPSYLVRSTQKPNQSFASVRLKCQPNMTIFTKVYLPEQFPFSDFNNYPAYPEYFVDFNVSFQAKLPQQLPYQEVFIENTSLLKFVQGISTTKSKMLQFPIYYFERRDEQQVQYLIGLFLFQQNSTTMELRFYFPNFLNYYELLMQCGNSTDETRRFAEQKFLQYLSTIPNYYAPCIRKNQNELNIQIQRQLIFLIDEQNQQLYMQKVKAHQARVQKNKKQVDDENYKNRQLHISRKSQCCAAFSENYQVKFQDQINCEFRQVTQYQKDVNFQRFLPQLEVQSCLPQMPLIQPTLRNMYLDSDEMEIRLEPQFCGNPWKLQRKTYRDGVEIKNDQEELQLEDMMLTKMDSEKKSQTKNRRKGFMRSKDIQNCNHKQVIIEQQEMEIEENKTESQSQSQSKSKYGSVKFNPHFQAKFKLIIQTKLNNSVSTNN